HAIFAHFAGEVWQLIAIPFEIVQRNREAAGGHDRFDVEYDDLALAGYLREFAAKLRPLVIAIVDDRAAAVEAEDQRPVLEAAEHDRQPPVFRQVRGRFALAASQVQVGDALIAEHAERVETFGRQVDAALIGGRGVEEDSLGGDELAQHWVEF